MGFDQENSLKTFVGVPQGAVLSPLLFNVMINDLFPRLKSKDLTALGYADDLAVVAMNYNAAHKAISTIKQWTTENGIEINLDKSAVIIARHSRQGRSIKNRIVQTHINDIPIREEYQYLGLTIRNDLKFHSTFDKKREDLSKQRARLAFLFKKNNHIDT